MVGYPVLLAQDLKMKILQAVDYFSLPHGGGTVDLMYKLSRALAQRGHEVVIYTGDFELDQEYIDSLPDVKVHLFHSWLNLSRVHLMPGIVMEVQRKLKEFDIIHLHCLRSFQNIVLYHYAQKYGIPYVVDAHGSLPKHGSKGFKWLLKLLFDVTFGYRLLRDAGRLIAETEVEINEYRELGVNQDMIVLFPPPFDTKEFSQLPSPGSFRNKYGIKEKHVVLFLGRINWIKGLDFLVKSFAGLVQSMSDVILVIVGSDDGYKTTIDKLIEDLDLSERVLFTGFLGGDEKISVLADADMMIQPSVYEQGARSALESILCNTPVIVSRNTGAGDKLGKMDAAYLVDFGNTSELRDMMKYIIENPAEAAGKTQKAKEYIKANLSLDKGIEKYEELYQELSSRKHE